MLAASTVSAEHILLGHGECLGFGSEDLYSFGAFERFTAVDLPSFFVDDLSECACPECATLCEATEQCIGYEFYCCKNIVGQTCHASGSVLFNNGTRPEGEPEAPFSIHPVGADGRIKATSGSEFPGYGDIQWVASYAPQRLMHPSHGWNDSDFFCYGKIHPQAELV